MFVFDITSLIYLAAVGQLDVLDTLDETCAVPQPVYDEVITEGVIAGLLEARRVERAIESAVLSVRPSPETDLADRPPENQNLTEADVSVIALAASENAVAVMDQRHGRSAAHTEGVETNGTAANLSGTIRNGQLNGAELIEVLDAMLEAGWYCSTYF